MTAPDSYAAASVAVSGPQSAIREHVYHRDLNAQDGASLAAIAQWVPYGARVLDLGAGSGALGRYLVEERQCKVAGLTLSQQEAQCLHPHYHPVVVANLEQVDLASQFPGRFDVVVCADVLEHLSDPKRVLDQLAGLLEQHGQVLISVPNVAYAGLIAELLAGDFRYRPEGLLDATHLRFFTQRSLLRFLSDAGWSCLEVQGVERTLDASEFSGFWERLHPSLQRYLQAAPGSGVYQWLVRARPTSWVGVADAQSLAVESNSSPVGHFGVALYAATANTQAGLDAPTVHFDTQRVQVARGLMGPGLQQIRFDLRFWSEPPTVLRVDWSERPGIMHLAAIRLLPQDPSVGAIWQWTPDGVPGSPWPWRSNEQVLPWPQLSSDTLPLMLLGDDPWSVLELSQDLLARARWLELSLSCPAGAEYAGLSAALGALAQQLQVERGHARSEALLLQQIRETLLVGHVPEATTAPARAVAQLLSEHQDLRLQHVRLQEAQRSEREELSSRLRESERLRTDRERALEDLQMHLTRIEQSTLFRLTRPLVRGKMRVDQWLGRTPAGAPTRHDHRLTSRTFSPQVAPARPITPPDTPVDVIVPVYRGLEETRRCIESVLAYRCVEGQPALRLVVINDASPEPEVTAWLRTLPQGPDLLLLENPVNLGFVGTVNRGMSLSEDHDVVLLNSDAEVSRDWLRRLRNTAYSHPQAGTVTPFSNNATICSYPKFCADNPLPADTELHDLDALFAQANAGMTLEIPTAVGFCMYIRRDCLRQTGLFDVERFGRGYGEENDFCMRALRLGWQHRMALDVFVRHGGGVSFGDEKSSRERDAQRILEDLYPDYSRMVHAFVAADPLEPWRQRVDLLRIQSLQRPAVLFITHDRAGGTLRHVQELAERIRPRALSFMLRPMAGGESRLEWANAGEAFRLGFRLPGEFDGLIQVLRALSVAHIHIHHLLGHHPIVWGLARRLGVPYDFTGHDFYPLCPQISLTNETNRYCGEQGIDQCRRCLRHSPAPGGVDIVTWRDGYRQLLKGARHVLVPSADAAQRYRRLAPEAHVVHRPHFDLDPQALPEPRPPRVLAERDALRIVVIGALSIIKGADLLEAVALEAARRGLQLDFHLVGYGYRSLIHRPRAHLTVHGEYRDEELPELLRWLEPDLMWFPAVWPETYSYTLSACLAAGLPVVVPNLGSFPERVASRPWSWVMPWQADAAEWATRFDLLRTEHFITALPPALPAVVPDTSVDPFEYDQDYLRGIAVSPDLDATSLAGREIMQYRAGRLHGSAQVRAVSKRLLLRGLVHLRSMPAFRQVARRIPLRWQTRIKTWLTT